MYPPRCCGQVIPLASVRSVIGPNLFAAFANKVVEFETTDRTYCANPSCHSFLPPGRIFKNIALCLKCGKTTCAICKSAAHLGSCPSGPTPSCYSSWPRRNSGSPAASATLLSRRRVAVTTSLVVAAIVSVTSVEDSLAAVDVMVLMLGIVNLTIGSTAPPERFQMLYSSQSSLGIVSISIVNQGIIPSSPASSSPILCAV